MSELDSFDIEKHNVKIDKKTKVKSEYNNVDAERIRNSPKYHQLIKAICKYNEKAKKWGYVALSFNPNKLVLSGVFIPKTDENKGFWSGMKSRYKDGYLEEDYYVIINICKELDIQFPQNIDWSKVK